MAKKLDDERWKTEAERIPEQGSGELDQDRDRSTERAPRRRRRGYRSPSDAQDLSRKTDTEEGAHG
jgi:hypothetical protein